MAKTPSAPPPPAPTASTKKGGGKRLRVLSPHAFIAKVFGQAAASSNFRPKERHLVNSAKALYRAYLTALEDIEGDSDFQLLLSRYDFFQD